MYAADAENREISYTVGRMQVSTPILENRVGSQKEELPNDPAFYLVITSMIEVSYYIS